MALSVPDRRCRGGLQVPLALRSSASCQLPPPRRPGEAVQGSRLDVAAGCWLRACSGWLESGGGDSINVTFFSAFAAAGIGSMA